MRKAREHIGLKQADFASEIGIGRTSLIHYETGQKNPPRLVLLAWAMATGVPPDWLLYGDAHSSPKSADVRTSPQLRRSLNTPGSTRRGLLRALTLAA